eukprot:163788_1
MKTLALWFISLTCIINAIAIRHHHHKHNGLTHAKVYKSHPQQLHRHYGQHGRKVQRRSRLYPKYAKTVDYDKILEWQEERDINDNMYDNMYHNIEEAMEFEVVNRGNFLAEIDSSGTYNAAGAKPLFRVHANKIQIQWPNIALSTTDAADRYWNFKDFRWKDMVKKFNQKTFRAAGRFANTQNQITHFRKKALFRLLEDTNGGGGGGANDRRICYDNSGSADVTSDLDFTLVRWDHPASIVTWLTAFYVECHALFGDYPGPVFDMNFYVATAIVSRKPNRPGALPMMHVNILARDFQRNCIGEVNVVVRDNLLTRIDNAVNPDYELRGIAEEYFQHANARHHDVNNGATYLLFDFYIQKYLITKRLLARAPLEPPKAMENLFRISKVYYNEIARLGAGPSLITMVNGGGANLVTHPHNRISNDNKLFIKTLLLWMNFYSEESYITCIALEDIWLRMKGEPGAMNVLPANLWRAAAGPHGVPPANVKPSWAVGMRPGAVAGHPLVKFFLYALDQFAFMRNYYAHAKEIEKGSHKAEDIKKRLVYFIDRISKYFQRTAEFLSALAAHGGANEGIANWVTTVGPALNNVAVPANTIGGITQAERLLFYRFYHEMKIWADNVRNKVPVSKVAEEHGNRNTAVNPIVTVADRETQGARNGAKVMHHITTGYGAPQYFKYASVDKVWNTVIKPIVDKMSAHIDGLVVEQNRKILGNAVEEMRVVIKNKIKHNRDSFTINDGTSTLADTFESVTDINLFAKAKASVSPTNKFLFT